MHDSLKSLVDADAAIRGAMDEHREALASLRAERCAAIAAARAEGIKARDIAAALGITRALVYEMDNEHRGTAGS